MPILDQGKQDKHIVGTNNYNSFRERIILTDPDPKGLPKQGAGKGEQMNQVPVGKPGSKERVDFGRVIGNFVDKETGAPTPTTKQ